MPCLQDCGARSLEQNKSTCNEVERMGEIAGPDQPKGTRTHTRFPCLRLTYIRHYDPGIHLTLESWRQDRDEEGWRLPEKDRRKRVREWREKASEILPEYVAKVPRYDGDVAALSELTKDETPPKILARPLKGSKVAILFGDASGEGFGSSLWIYGTSTIETEHGLWTRAYGSRSSNFREFYNLVLRLEALVDDGTIEYGSEVFMFTDNSTAEAAFFRGTSTSKLLYDLVLRTKRMEMRGCIFLRVIWVAGTRMIEQGTDLLMKTLREGRNSKRIQFETARKIRSVVSCSMHYGRGYNIDILN